MGKQLALIPGAPPLDADRVRVALAVKRTSTPRELPVIGFLPAIEDEFRTPIRSKRQRVSAPRLLREGDRPQSLGTARPSRKERQSMHRMGRLEHRRPRA